LGDLNTQKTLSRSSKGPPFNIQPRIYDLASLTKVIVTSSLLFEDWLETKLSWQDYRAFKIVKVLSELQKSNFADLTIAELWEHNSGFPAHVLLFGNDRKSKYTLSNRPKLHADLLKKLTQLKKNNSSETVYSDLGYILLGIYLERKYQKTLLEIWNEYCEKWQLWGDYFSYCPPVELLANIIPTEQRHRLLEVNDDNTAAMNGISSHAGLFASVEDISRWLKHISQRIDDLPEIKNNLMNPASRFVCGWDTASTDGKIKSQAGKTHSKYVRGFLGWTGTAFWWDMKSLRAGILLSNRVFPQHTLESQAEIREIRYSFFSRIWQNRMGELGEVFSFNEANQEKP
jgi:CubicO group peptidase (beta-lactamase class C family)